MGHSIIAKGQSSGSSDRQIISYMIPALTTPKTFSFDYQILCILYPIELVESARSSEYMDTLSILFPGYVLPVQIHESSRNTYFVEHTLSSDGRTLTVRHSEGNSYSATAITVAIVKV